MGSWVVYTPGRNGSYQEGATRGPPLAMSSRSNPSRRDAPRRVSNAIGFCIRSRRRAEAREAGDAPRRVSTVGWMSEGSVEETAGYFPSCIMSLDEGEMRAISEEMTVRKQMASVMMMATTVWIVSTVIFSFSVVSFS